MYSLVSIVIPAYNREKTVIRAVESVLKQDYPNLEVIVVDDCSTDDTYSVLVNTYSGDPRVVVTKLETNSGACVARNKGIELSNGEYIAFLDSDDIYYENKLTQQINALKGSNKDLCATDYDRIDSKGKKTKIAVSQYEGESLYNDLLFCNYITTGTLIGRRECFEDVYFDTRLPRYQDWDLALRLSKKYSFCLLNVSTLLQEEQTMSITTSTGHKKTLDALTIIYEKNKNALMNNAKARSQIEWLIGVHSMYTNTPKFDYLWRGASTNGINLKRIIIWCLYKIKIGKWCLKI